MTTDLGRRLQDLAVDAPPSLPTEGLWDRGVRRQRTRRAAAAAATVAVLAAVIGGVSLQSAHDLGDGSPSPAATPAGVGHLPRTIHVPAAWSEGTKDAGELGALSVLGSSDRKRPKGLAGMVAYSSMYGISAVDGTARFLDLPTSSNPDMPGEVSLNAALSPDGRKVAFPRYDWSTRDSGGQETLIGWAVYDAVTGKIVELADSGAPRMKDSVIAPVFSGDSSYLLTTYVPEGNNDSNAHEFVAWDAVTGARTVLEAPGKHWAPNVGSSSRGIVWSRADKTFTYDPATEATTSIRTAHDPVAASFAPSGTGFAYVGGKLTADGINAPWQLYVGSSPDHMLRVSGANDFQGILGWRDPRHVVVAITNRDYGIVDVSDGSMQQGRINGAAELYLPTLAADLWANDLVDGVRPPHTSDPRTPGRLAVLAGLLVVGAGFTLYRRRRRHG